MGTIIIEYSHGYNNHEEEVIGLHVNMGNVKTKFNERRGRHEPVTMRSMHREV
jgi:hypothetical protein